MDVHLKRAATGARQAMASRLMMPEGSHTDGQTKRAARLQRAMSLWMGEHLVEPDQRVGALVDALAVGFARSSRHPPPTAL